MQVPTNEKGRLVGAKIEAHGNPDFAVMSCYFKTGKKGMSGRNLDLISDVGVFASEANVPCVAAGDYNCDPELIAQTGFLFKAKAVALASELSQPTCIMKKSETRIVASYVLATSNVVQ
jgi:catabolite regulation protein CreA